MKKFTLSLAFAALMTAVALIFSGCSDDPEVGPEAPVISAKDMQVPATAGKQKLAYSIAHPVEGQSISAESDQTWIHDFEYTDANIAFQVDANEGEARTAALTLKYEGAADLKVEIKQMAFDASIEISPKALSFGYTRVCYGDQQRRLDADGAERFRQLGRSFRYFGKERRQGYVQCRNGEQYRRGEDR